MRLDRDARHYLEFQDTLFMSVGRKHESTVPPSWEVFIPEQVAFGISIFSDNSGILFLVVRASESLLAFFGASLVCDNYVLDRAKTFY